MLEALAEFNGWLFGFLFHQPDTLWEFQVAALVKSVFCILLIALIFWISSLINARGSNRGK